MKSFSQSESLHDVYVGAISGALKGVSFGGERVDSANLNDTSALCAADDEVCSMCWADGLHPQQQQQQTQLLLGLRSPCVKVYDTQRRQFTWTRQLAGLEGPIVSLAVCEGRLVTATQSGSLSVWDDDAAADDDVDASECLVTIGALNSGLTLCRMVQSPETSHLVATGGRDNDLQLWNLQRPDQPQFRAKNVRPDMLELRVPVWLTDIAFLNSSRCVATCHKHSFVRVYDLGANQRRPVLSVTVPDQQPLTCLTVTNVPHQILVGSGRGLLALYDLRMVDGRGGGSGSAREVGRLRGVAGGVRDLACHPSRPLAASVSLDRHLRIHELSTRTLAHQVYLKAQLNCVLLRSSFDLPPKTLPLSHLKDLSRVQPSYQVADSEKTDEIEDVFSAPCIAGKRAAINEAPLDGLGGNSESKMPPLRFGEERGSDPSVCQPEKKRTSAKKPKLPVLISVKKKKCK